MAKKKALDNTMLPGSRYRATHKASVVGILGDRAPRVESKGKQFYNRNRWTCRVLITKLCDWAKANPGQVLSRFELDQLVNAANCHTLGRGEQAIVIAQTPDKLPRDMALALIGGGYHEAWHTQYSCTRNLRHDEIASMILPRWPQVPDWSKFAGILLEWSNIIEDIRIERLGCKEFPGTVAKMHELQDFVLRQEMKSRLEHPDGFTSFAALSCTFRDMGLGYNTEIQASAMKYYIENHADAVRLVESGPLRPILDQAIALNKKDDTGCLRLALDVIIELTKLSQQQPPSPPQQGEQGDGEGQGQPSSSDDQDGDSNSEPQSGNSNPNQKESKSKSKPDNKKSDDSKRQKPQQKGGEEKSKDQKSGDSSDSEDEQDGDEKDSSGSGDSDEKDEKQGDSESSDSSGEGGEDSEDSDADDGDSGSDSSGEGQSNGQGQGQSDSGDEPELGNTENPSESEKPEGGGGNDAGGHNHVTGESDRDLAQEILDQAAQAQDKGETGTKDYAELMEEAISDISEDEMKDCKQGEQPWRPYTLENDEIRIVRANKGDDLDRANQILTEVREQARYLRARFRTLLRSMEIKGSTHGLRRGKGVSERFLVDSYATLRDGALPKRAYYDEDETIDMSLSAAVVIDESGSMSGRLALATAVMMAITEPLDSLGCKVQVSGFRDGRGTQLSWHEHQQAIRGGGYHRTEGIIHDVFKTFDEPFRNVKARFSKTKACGGTPMSDGVQFGLDALNERQEAHRILFIITDGCPNGDHVPVINRQLRLAKEAGIHVVGVGIGHGASYVKNLFPDSVYHPNMEKLPKLLVDKLNELVEIRNPKRGRRMRKSA